MAGRRGRDRFTRRRRSNRPGNSQAKDPPVSKTLKNGDVRYAPTPADGITLSGTQTEGAPMPDRLMFGISMRAYPENCHDETDCFAASARCP